MLVSHKAKISDLREQKHALFPSHARVILYAPAIYNNNEGNFQKMNRKRILKRIYLPLLFLATVLAVGFRTSAMFFDFNSRIGYFDGKGLINTASIMAK